MSSRPSRGAARLAAILDALPDALLLVNRNGTVVNANAMALEVLEAPGTPLVGRGLLDLLPTFDRSRIPGSVRGNEPRDARTKPTRMSAHRTDGRTFPVEVTSANLPAGYDDELLMIVVRDLTGKMDVEVELSRQQRQTEMILRAASEGIIGIDVEGHIVLANPAAARILRHRASDLGGKNVHELLMHSRADGTSLAAADCPPLATLDSGRRQRLHDQVLWRGDKGYVTVDMITAPILLGGTVVGAVMTFGDTAREKLLTERRAQLAEFVDAEMLGRLEAVRGRLKKVADGLAGDIGHGARRMVRQVSGELEDLEELAGEVIAHQVDPVEVDPKDSKEPKESKDAKIAKVAGSVTGDKGAEADTSGKGPKGSDAKDAVEATERLATTVDDLVDRAVETVTYLARGRGVEFVVNASPVGVRVDVVAMTRAIGHLLADTVAAGPEGSSVVIAAAERGGSARIEVRGPESRGSTVRVPLARAVIEAHGGTLEAHTTPGRGSTYVVELPADAEAAEEAGSSGEHRAAKGRRARTAVRLESADTKKDDKKDDGTKNDADRDDAADDDAAEDDGVAADAPHEAGDAADPVKDAAPAVPTPGRAIELAVRGRAAAVHPGRARLELVGPSTPPVPAPPPPGSVAPARQGPFALPPGATPSVVEAGRGGAGRHDRADDESHDAVDDVEEAARNNSGAFDAVYPPRSRRGRAAREGNDTSEPDAPTALPRRPATAPAVRVNGAQNAQVPQTRRRLSTPPTPAPIPAQGRTDDAQARSTSVRDRPLRAPADDMPTELLSPIPSGPGPVPSGRAVPLTGPSRRPSFAALPPGRDTEATSGADLPTMVAPAPDGQPRRLLVWPEPDAATAGALTARGWSPLLVRSREEVDASVPAQPAALFVDPLTGPITRTALQSLRTAATAAQIPVLVTAGLMQATRDAAFGADPAVLLRSLAPADSAGHASRVLLVEANPDIASAFTASLERRGMDVVHAASESEAVSKASSVEPNLVVLDLMLVRRRRVGVVDWLRNNARLHSTPIVVYTTLDLIDDDLHRLQTGETVLFLAERSTREDVQQRIVDLLGKIASPK